MVLTASADGERSLCWMSICSGWMTNAKPGDFLIWVIEFETYLRLELYNKLPWPPNSFLKNTWLDIIHFSALWCWNYFLKVFMWAAAIWRSTLTKSVLLVFFPQLYLLKGNILSHTEFCLKVNTVLLLILRKGNNFNHEDRISDCSLILPSPVMYT